MFFSLFFSLFLGRSCCSFSPWTQEEVNALENQFVKSILLCESHFMKRSKSAFSSLLSSQKSSFFVDCVIVGKE